MKIPDATIAFLHTSRSKRMRYGFWLQWKLLSRLETGGSPVSILRTFVADLSGGGSNTAATGCRSGGHQNLDVQSALPGVMRSGSNKVVERSAIRSSSPTGGICVPALGAAVQPDVVDTQVPGMDTAEAEAAFLRAFL